MNFKMQCINYLLVNGWAQDVDGWEWGHSQLGYAETIGSALDAQLEYEDSEPNPEPDA